MPDPFPTAIAALDDCDAALRRLHLMCCEPGRSPRLAAVADELTAVRAGVRRVPDDPALIDPVLEQLETLGGKIGVLQVGCCAPERMPLYARLLAGFATIQISLNHHRGQGH